ncbi:hypothetical protein [Thiocapsa sp. N5-Cardenillas]|uniref:hypothetical protein n=1 Tax=Thiocapsa sp. N5-Cardenillas TaxID=3137397 RepID=UPI0035B0247E
MPTQEEARSELQRRQAGSADESVDSGSSIRTGFGGIGRDIAESLINSPGAALKGLSNIPRRIASGYEYAGTHAPIKTLGQNVLGLGEGVAGILSAPQMLARYIAEKSTGRDNTALHRTPTPYELLQQGEQAAGLMPTEEGEAEVRGLGQIPLLAYGASRIPSAAGRAAGMGATAGGQGGDPIHAALLSLLGEKGVQKMGETYGRIPEIRERRAEMKAIPDTQAALAESARQAENAGYNLQQTQDLASRRFGSSSIPRLERNIDVAQQKIQEAKPVSEQQMPPRDALVEPDEPSFSIADAQQQHQQSVNDIQQHLYHRQEPDVIASREVVADFENNVKGAAQDLYKANDDLLRNESIKMPVESNPSVYIGDLQEILDTSGWGTTQAASLAKQLNAINKTEEIPAREFYNAARTARQTAAATRKNAYSGGKTAEEFDRLIAKADKLDDQAQSMFDVLEQAPFGEEVMSNLSEANRLWREQVAPVERNSLYKQMKSKGRVDGRILDKLRGTETGLDVINRIISNNPVATRASFGDAYANNPNLLLNMSQREQQMAAQHPEFQQRIDRLATTSQGIQQTEQAHAQHRSALEQFNEAVKTAKKIDDAKKVVAKEVKNIQGLSMMIDKLKADLSRKGLSIQKTKELTEKLNKAISDKDKKSALIWRAVSSVGSVFMGNELIGLIKKITK